MPGDERRRAGPALGGRRRPLRAFRISRSTTCCASDIAPPKVGLPFWTAWHDRQAAPGPTCPKRSARSYTIGEIKRWLAVFLERFFETSQYKRSCIANGPKVGSGGSLSPRGD